MDIRFDLVKKLTKPLPKAKGITLRSVRTSEDGTSASAILMAGGYQSIRESVEKYGLFRCQRSYYVNVAHVSALRKDPNDVINAELDCGGIRVPVSRNQYMELASRL